MAQEFRESRALLADAAAVRTRFAEDGYLFFRGLVPEVDVLAVRDEVLARLADAGWLAPGSEPGDARPGPTVVNEGDEAYFPVYERLQSTESFHRLAHHPALTAALRALVGDDLLVHPRKIARVNFPDNAFGTTAPHQDYRYIQAATDTFTAWLPLGACGGEQGGLQVLRGSHLAGLRPFVMRDALNAIAVDVAADDPDWRTAAFEPGDVLVFHSLTVHGAVANTGGRLRLSVDYRYQSAADPVLEASLHPHYHPLIADWPALTADWASERWIEAPDGVPRAELRAPTDDLDPPPSRYFTHDVTTSA